MPEPVRGGQRYLPGLDGLRAVAVLAVIAYHEQFGWAAGGLLGVGVFFTLSGYLITDLLLGQWAAGHRLGLGGFWLRRARRLLPALFVMLAVVSAWVTVFDRSQLAGLRGAVAAAAGYVSNWYLIGAHSSYFAAFAPPAPLDHLWSLAVEEQFYLVWPWLLIAGLASLPRRRPPLGPEELQWRLVDGVWRRPGRQSGLGRWLRRPGGMVPWLALPTLVLAAASAAAMAALYHPGLDPTRAYEGTDTRACGLLVGAALAMCWPTRRASGARGRDRATRLLDGGGVAGLAVMAIMIWRVGQYSPFAYRGGIGLLSVATAAVVAAVACPGSLAGRALGWRPLRWIGVRSYGIYLWHYPVIVLTSPANSGEDLPRAVWQTAASIALAALSWRLVEEPVRHGALGRAWRQARASRGRVGPAGLADRVGWAGRVAGWAALASASGVLMVACAGLAGAVGAHTPGASATLAQPAGATLPQPAPTPLATSLATAGGASPAGPASPRGAATGKGASPQATTSGRTPVRTSCQQVFHIGDSTSEGLISPDYLPNPARRIPARYASVGVRRTYTFIEGATSVVETLPGTVNAYQAARRMLRRGYRGCWVIALGTNDTADVVVGSAVSRSARISKMMALAHGQPVMWVDVKSLRASGPYAQTYMRQWNAALREACARYPNMRIFDWASVAKDRWFIPDGIHYTSAGYAARARLIAGALARAFPATGASPGCVVR